MFKKKPIKIYYLFFILLFIGCSNLNNDSKTHSDIDTKSETIDGDNNSENADKDDESVEESDNGCKYNDGTHSATVYYYNPETGTRSTYTLDVEVENCEVTQIDFPNGGYLDDCHIEPTELDSDGEATVEDDKGRKFKVHIDD